MERVCEFLTNDKFVQDPRYVSAVDKLYWDYRNTLKSMGDNDREVRLRDLMSKTNLDFNTLRKAINDIKNEKPVELNSVESTETLNESRKQDLILKIENLIENLLKDIVEGKFPKLIIRNQALWDNCVFGEKVTLKTVEDSLMVSVNFKNKNSKEKFALLLHLLSIIHDMLVNKVTCTKRELYYQNIIIVKSQSNIDNGIRDICCLLDAPQWELGVIATSKGLIAGPLEIITKEGNIIPCMNPGGVLIPQDVIGIKSVKSNAKFILVVEKDATFQKLLDEGALERLKPCILITGKGYPDVNTRLMLKYLVDYLKIPPLALVDADPHGIEIMCTYRFGSLSMSHIAEKLAVPSLRWLGVHPEDIIPFGAPKLPLSARDKAKANDLLLRPYFQTNTLLNEQVKLLLRENMKTELEGIDIMSKAFLTDIYIPHKLYTNTLI